VQPGDKIGSHEVLALIGQGGMGEVYRAHDKSLARDVAIKVLPAALSQDPDRLARFEREAKVLAAMNHPNIAIIYGLESTATNARAIVMELVEGPTLADRLEHGPLPLDETLSIARQIADALEAAHEKGVVHRDLKPANVKVREDGTVKVLDFGLATAVQAGVREPAGGANSPTLTLGATEVGMILGTAAYMAPEQAAGKPVDRRADIWSFGVVLWEMLTGKRLFLAEDVTHTLADVLRKPIDFAELPEATPAPVRELLKRCLDRDVKNRLQWIGEARVAITKYLAHPSVDVGPEPGVPSGGRRYTWAWAAAVGVLAALALGASLVAWRATRPVDRPLMRLSVDLGPDAVAGRSTTAVLSPDGTRVVFPVRLIGGGVQLAILQLDQAKASPLPGTVGVIDPFFSPDGQWIGFFASGKLKKVAVQGGAPVTLCDAGAPKGGSWDEDGNIIFSPVTASSLMRIPAAGGTPQPLTKLAQGEATHRWPQVLPGGQAVLFTANAFDNAYINVMVLKTGEVKTILRGAYFGRYVPSPQGGGHLLYVHEGTLFAVAFDPDRLETRGSAVPLLDDLAADSAQGGGQFDWARNGSLVYVSGKTADSSYPIVWMDSSGKTAPLLAKPNVYGAPRFSPDGKRLAFTAPSPKGIDVWVYDWERDTPTQLTFNGPGNIEMAWTPDGKHIIYGSTSGTAGELWWIRSDGSGEPQKLLEQKNVGIGLRAQSFTPDGRRLAFDENLSGVADVNMYTLPLDVSDPDHPKPGKPEPFLVTPAREVDSAFSPDGHWMAYASNESGVDDVFVRPFPGPGGKWRISTGGGKYPTWSRNGRELFFLSADEHIMVTEYTAKGDSFSSGRPRVWSDRQVLRPTFIRALDLHPDGKRFAVFERPAEEKASGNLHVTFLLNFTDELRRRVPATR